MSVISNALKKLDRVALAQDKFNIFTSLNRDARRQLSENNDDDYPSKPLQNVLYALKDNITTTKLPTTCGSKILEGYVSPFNSTVAELLESSGAVSVGKTNLDEFGMGTAGLHSYFGPTFNPLYEGQKVVVGGSSSGSAAAVAAEVVDFALGTDTGGSIRLPAAWTSTLGFKPSYGRISRFGVVAYAQSLDTVGIISKDIKILKSVFQTLDHYDSKDPTSLSNEFRRKAKSLTRKNSKLKIGLPIELNQKDMPEVVKTAFYQAVDKLMKQGHEFYKVSIPSVINALPIYYTLAPIEAVSNLSRYDGIRYGFRAPTADFQDSIPFAVTRAAFGPEVQKRLVLGNYNLSSERYKNSYITAQNCRASMVKDFDKVFSFPNLLSHKIRNEGGLDLLLSPTAVNLPSSVAKYVKEENTNLVNSYVNDVFTIPMSLCGLPSISVPMRGCKSAGIQLTGQHGDDATVLSATQHLM
ncbi:LAMI_0F15698g1_1 [Lachancea mirantina]|uniref:Glutamyl-tRNA(Gln) amidotransferase subunit A, mitochondrial n=1 Tax=Lachancea mirantina TaxID=1230905 RepID=A0A1G4K4F9_9SACH|nr:LAMI_0F15698g1_1 [Lachancea mirantina]